MNVRTQKTVDIAYQSFEEVMVELRATGLSEEKIQLLLEDLKPTKDVSEALDDESNESE
jgi:vacuolar-type H+-ATPase subunit D/Vma8